MTAWPASDIDCPIGLVIAGGRGWLYDDILVAAREAGMTQVLLAGYVDDSDLPALYYGRRRVRLPLTLRRALASPCWRRWPAARRC
jgi:hypothetical protein